jgi:hypothetical protein
LQGGPADLRHSRLRIFAANFFIFSAIADDRLIFSSASQQSSNPQSTMLQALENLANRRKAWRLPKK